MGKVTNKTIERAAARVKYEEAKVAESKARGKMLDAAGDPVKRAKAEQELKEAQLQRQEAGRVARGKRR